jgi:hypothetical protein
MGKADCPDNREFSDTYDVTNKAVNELGKAKNRTRSSEGKRTLQRAILACQKAVIQLFKMRQQHQQRCPECKKGD